MRDYLRTFSLCFEFWKNYRSTEPFPGIGFQTTNERRSPDDLPCSEVKQSNPIRAEYRPGWAKRKRLFHSPKRPRIHWIEPSLAARSGLCQDRRMKHLLLACLFQMALTAQTMQQLTEQLGKTVLYGDIALSPDGTHVACVQSAAASTSKQTYVRETSGSASATFVKLPITGERTDFDLAWSPDSKTLAFLSSAGERDQRQLWTVRGDASDAKRITKLNGYAARPRWSHDGKQIAFLYIDGAGGG